MTQEIQIPWRIEFLYLEAAMTKLFLILGSLSGALSVALGAFAAHALRERLEPRMLEVFKTGVQYQMMHALALLAVAWVCSRTASPFAPAAGICFLAGTLLFSGSLYAMTMGGPKWLGPITPLGGLSFMLGWLCLAAAAWKMQG